MQTSRRQGWSLQLYLASGPVSVPWSTEAAESIHIPLVIPDLRHPPCDGLNPQTLNPYESHLPYIAVIWYLVITMK